ncbi:MAG: FtsX-like permease family protein [Gemmataceae bacterium]
MGSPPPSRSAAGSASSPARFSLGLAGWLARRGLTGPGQASRTRRAAFAVALCLAIALVPLLLAAGSRAVHDLALRRRPLCIWVGDRAVTQQITPERLAALRAALRERLGSDADRVQEVPFDEFSHQWLATHQRGGQRLRYDFTGRTLAADDPLWGRIPLRNGRAPKPSEPGVIVSAAMLRELAQDDGTPETLELILPTSNRPQSIPLLAVVEADSLPSGHDFALDPTFERQLRTEDPEQRTRAITTGPVSAAWAEADLLPPAQRDGVRRAFTFYELGWPPVPHKLPDERLAWRLRSRADEDPTLREWATMLGALAQALRREGLIVEPAFETFSAPTDRADPPPRSEWNRLTLATDEPALLRPMARAAAAVGLPTYDVVIDQMEQIDREAAIWAWANLGIGLGSAGAAALLLTLLARARVREQRHPIGMLRAMGCSTGLLFRVHLLEGVVVWLFGLLLGLLLTVVATVLIAACLGWPWQAWLHVRWPVVALTLSLAGSLVVCLMSSLTATRALAVGSPIDLLRQDGP